MTQNSMNQLIVKIAKFLKIDYKKYIFNEVDLIKLLPDFLKLLMNPFLILLQYQDYFYQKI